MRTAHLNAVANRYAKGPATYNACAACDKVLDRRSRYILCTGFVCDGCWTQAWIFKAEGKKVWLDDGK